MEAVKGFGPIDRLVDYLSALLLFAGATAMLLMMAHVCLDVAGRYLFNHPLPGTLESVTYYYMVMVTALPFAYVTRTQGQITVEMFTNWMPRRSRALLEALVGLVVLAYLLALAWKTGEEAIAKTALGELRDAGVTQIIVWPTRWFPPLGLGTMAFAVILRIAKDFADSRQP